VAVGTFVEQKAPGSAHGADFISTTKLVLELGSSRCHFSFAPAVCINFVPGKDGPPCSRYRSLSSSTNQVKLGKLSFSQQKKLEDLISKYPDVLNQELGLTHLMEYDIQLLDNTPVRLAPYRLAPPKMQYLRRHITKLLKEGVIEPSFSNYSSPMFLVPKSAGGYRTVVDFLALNKRIAVESVPLPDIHSAFHWFAKAKYFTTLDLNQAYHQIPLAKASKPLTPFAQTGTCISTLMFRLASLQGLKC
jgi:hypothetical protein